MIAEKKAEAEAKKKKDSEPPIEAPIVAACVIEENMIHQNYWRGFTSLGDGCDSYKCDENYVQNFPTLQLDIVPPDYAGFDYCNNLVLGAVGVTDVLFDWDVSDPEKKGKLLVPFKIEELCFDDANNYWNYNIISKNTSEFSNIFDRWDSFYLRIVSTVCLDAYVNSGTDFTLIQSIEELSTKISVEDVCLTLQDFEYNRPYAGDPLFQEDLHDYIQLRNNTSEFKFCEIVPADTMHEHLHYLNIEKEVFSTLNIRVPELSNKKYSTLLKHIELQCEQAKTPEEAKLEIDKQYKRVLARFVEDLKKSDDKRTNDPKNENNTQWSRMVQNLITEYQNELKRIYPGGGHCSIIELTRRDI
jgi:REP element-mobilizing transposase RayT